MKKIVIYLSMILMIFSLAGCNQNNKLTDINVDIGEYTKFSKEEIDNVVDNSGDNPVLNSGETYTNYNWILIRDDKNSNWKVYD